MVLNDFCDWLKENTSLSDSSIEHYERGFRAVSKDMIEWNVIKKPLSEMTLAEYNIAVSIIFTNPNFSNKNKIGGRMYSNALKHYASFLKTNFEERIIEDELTKAVEEEKFLSQTEKNSIIKSRIGQGLFRKKLLQKYENRCIITGINDTRLLIASHIKPWEVSNNEERISKNNGLILSSTYDKLFDIGLITFENSGKILISNDLNVENRKILNLENGTVYDIKFSDLMKKNLEYHRDVRFLGNSGEK